MPSEEKDVIDDLVETVRSYNSQSMSALSRKKEDKQRTRIKSNEDTLVINMVHSESEDDEVKKDSSDTSTSSPSDLQSSSLTMNQKDEFKNDSTTDYLNVLKYELKEKDLDIVELQKEINELQLENKLLKAKIPFYSTQFSLLDDEAAKTMDIENPYIKEMLIFKREKDVAIEELMKAQDTISRLTMDKNIKSIDTFDPNSPDLLKKKLKTFERQIRELEHENERYSNELGKCEKNYTMLKNENGDLRLKLNENKILYEREQNLLVDMADLKNELKKLKQANSQLIETNKRLIDELNHRPEPVLPLQCQESITVSTQTFSDQNEKTRKIQQIDDSDLNTTYCVEQRQKSYSSHQNYPTRSNYESYLTKNDDYLINNFRPFNPNGVQYNHKKSHPTQSSHSHRVVEYDYDHYHQRNFDYPRQKHYTKYEDDYRPESSESMVNNKIKERSKSLKRSSSNETLDDYNPDMSKKKSLKINVMRDIKSAQKLKMKRFNENENRRSYYNEEPMCNHRDSNLRRSMTFTTSKSSKNLYEQNESDLNSTPSDSQINFYKYHDEDEFIARTYRSKSVDRVTAMERKIMENREEEISQKELMSRKRPFVPLKPDDIRIGDFLKFSRPGGKISKGMVKYIGPLPDRNDVYFGLELDSEEGKHDGVYNDKRYFQTKPNKGVFVSFSKVVMAWG